MNEYRATIKNHITDEHEEQQYVQMIHERHLGDKLSYIDPTYWLGICDSDGYRFYKASIEHIQNIKKDISKYFDSGVSIIAIGPGDGKKEIALAAEIHNKAEVVFYGIDYSAQMLEVAKSNLRSAFEGDCPQGWFVADFSEDRTLSEIGKRIRSEYPSPQLFSLLGNTIGNYKQSVILPLLREAMELTDFLLIEVHLSVSESDKESQNTGDGVLIRYEIPEVEDSLMSMLQPIGVTTEHGDIVSDFGPDRYYPEIFIMEQYFRFSRDTHVSYNDHEFYFASGERILLNTSRKYPRESVTQLLKAHGFEIVNEAASERNEVLTVLCRLLR